MQQTGSLLVWPNVASYFVAERSTYFQVCADDEDMEERVPNEHISILIHGVWVDAVWFGMNEMQSFQMQEVQST